MTRRTYSILAGMIGTAVGAWWWNRQRTRSENRLAVERGTTIFRNTPTPTALSDEGII